MSWSAKLAELGIELPAVPAPAGAYVPAVRSGSLVFTAGQVPFVAGKIAATGKVGREMRRLVPILQRSTLAYLRDPAATNAAIVRIVSDLRAGYTYSAERAEFAVRQLRELGIANDGRTALVGDFDLARIRTVLDELRPILAGQGRPVAADLTPERLATNEFLDETTAW